MNDVEPDAGPPWALGGVLEARTLPVRGKPSMCSGTFESAARRRIVTTLRQDVVLGSWGEDYGQHEALSLAAAILRISDSDGSGVESPAADDGVLRLQRRGTRATGHGPAAWTAATSRRDRRD